MGRIYLTNAERGVRIKEFRKQRGMSQLQLAGSSFLDQSAISRMESGKGPDPTLNTIQHISDALGVDATKLIYADPDSELERDIEDATEILRNVSFGERKTIMKMLYGLSLS